MSFRAECADLPGMSPSGRADRIRSRWQREAAQTLAEYAVVLAVITPVVILAFASLSEAVLPAINAVRGFL
jgi:Flp pilus assembly pilin Flp